MGQLTHCHFVPKLDERPTSNSKNIFKNQERVREQQAGGNACLSWKNGVLQADNDTLDDGTSMSTIGIYHASNGRRKQSLSNAIRILPRFLEN